MQWNGKYTWYLNIKSRNSFCTIIHDTIKYIKNFYSIALNYTDMKVIISIQQLFINCIFFYWLIVIELLIHQLIVQNSNNYFSLLINCIEIELIDMKVLLPFKSQFQGENSHQSDFFIKFMSTSIFFVVCSTICLEIEMQLKANATIIEFFINFIWVHVVCSCTEIYINIHCGGFNRN